MRASGILMGISSIPSKYGIGCFSKEAYDFVDQLEKAGQQYWQILPLGPTGYGDSPYQSFSTFAGNPYFISLDELIEEGVLTRAECEKVNWGKAKGSIDKAFDFSKRFGSKGVFVCRLLPVVRTIVSLISGTVKEDIVEFTIYSTFGIAIWNLVFIFGGYITSKALL